MQSQPQGPAIFICNICQVELNDQYTFFNHLKTHYEENVHDSVSTPTLILHQEQQLKQEHVQNEEENDTSVISTVDTEVINITSNNQKQQECGEMIVQDQDNRPCSSSSTSCSTNIQIIGVKSAPVLDMDHEDVEQMILDEENIHDFDTEIDGQPQIISTPIPIPIPSQKKQPNKRGKNKEKKLIELAEQQVAADEDEEVEGDDDGFSPPSSPSTANRKRASRDVLKCPECDRIFNHRNSLVYHMRSHTGERPHQCHECGKSFFATSALKVHMRLHSGEKPYKCEHCDRHFRQWGDLKYHVISIHSDIRQYQCEFCGKDFARKYSLIVHRRIHTGERNYKCEFCGKSFRAASYLQNHRRIHTGEKPHSCDICGKPFRVRSDMKRHMASHNREHGNQQQQRQNNQQQVVQLKCEQVVQHEQPTHSVQNIVTVNSNDQIITIGPQITQLVRHSNINQQETQQISLEDDDEVISGDLSEGTPINITLTQDGRATLDGTTVTTLESALHDGETHVTIRDPNTGTHTLYVWPVYMN